MPAVNSLINIETWNRSTLGVIQNYTPLLALANTQYKDFPGMYPANLGASVAFDEPPRLQAYDSIVPTFQGVAELRHTLTVDQEINISYEFTDQERIFNVSKSNNDYLPIFIKAAAVRIGAAVDANIARNFTSSVVSKITGLPNVNSGPYRFYGDGRTSISTYVDFDTALVRDADFGAPRGQSIMVVPSTVSSSVIANGLNQFAIDRNNKLAQSWEIANFGTPECKVVISNQLPRFVAGSVGQNKTVGANILTVTGTNYDPTTQTISQITCSGATANDTNAIKYSDRMAIEFGTSGLEDIFFLNYLTGLPGNRQVQFRATQNAAADGSGNVTFTIFPTLQVSVPNTLNIGITSQVIAGTKIKVMDSCVVGCIIHENALFVGMPPLPRQTPYDSSVETDENSKMSMRLTYGSFPTQNLTGFIHAAIWGSFLAPNYCSAMLFPINTL